MQYRLTDERFQELKKILEEAGLALREQIRGKRPEEQMRQIFNTAHVPAEEMDDFVADLQDADAMFFHENFYDGEV